MDMREDDSQEPSQPAEEVQGPQDTPEPQTPTTPEPEEEEKRPHGEQALAEMRQLLREDEAREESEGGLKRFVKRIFGRRKPKVEEPIDTPSRLDALQFPEPPPVRKVAPAVEQPPETTTAATEPEARPRTTTTDEPKVDFESLVRNRLSEAFTARERQEPVEPPPAYPVEEEPYPMASSHSILTTLRQEDEAQPEETANIRQDALEDYSIAPEEPEQEPGTPMVRTLKRSWRYMRPAEKRLLTLALSIVGLAVLVGVVYLIKTWIDDQNRQVTVVATATSRIEPIPISVSLPGGWVFPLGTCSVAEDGSWHPASACWLNGTDVYRWVSLPWTEQLQAVVRTFKANDPIQLSMSNYDAVIFKVKAIEQIPASSIGKLKYDKPCLFLILSKDKADTIWVVTAELTTAKP